jgi:hypothetical protein
MMTSDIHREPVSADLGDFIRAKRRAAWLRRLTTSELSDWLAAVQGECTARGLYVGDLLSQVIERVEARA